MLSMKFRISAALLIFILISSLFGASLFRTKSSDVLPPLTEITSQQLKESKTTRTLVETGAYVRFLDAFNILNNKIVMNLFVWFYFNPDEVKLDTIEKFSFLNGIILHKSPPNIEKKENKLFVQYQVNVEMHSELTFYYFPLDNHKVSLILTNNYISPDKMLYITEDNNFNISPIVYLSSWDIQKLIGRYGYFSSHLDDEHNKQIVSPQAQFILDIKNTEIKNSIILFMPLLFAMLLALLSLLITFDPKGSSNRLILSLSSGATTSLLAYRFVIQSMIPQVGYATLTDWIYTLALTISFIIFLMEIVFIIAMQHKKTKLEKKDHEKELSDKINLISVYSFCTLSLISVIALYKILII